MRSEGNKLLEAIDELITISKQSGAPAEIYHFKQAGEPNWGKLDAAIARVEAARASGQRITADMYTYTAGATGLDAAMPTWVQAGGLEAWIKRLKDPAIRARLVKEMRTPSNDWENLLLLAGSPDQVLLVAFKNPKLKPLTGKTLGEVARMRGKSPEETAMDLVIEDGSRVGTVYFLMSEDNVKREAGAAVDELRLRRGVGGARGRVPEIEQPPARLRQFRAGARANMCARMAWPHCPMRSAG